MRSLAYFLLSASFVAAADWKSKPFPDWDQDAVQQILVDSPWTRQRTVRLFWQKHEDRPFSYKDVPGADPATGRIPGSSPVGGIGSPKKSSIPDRADLLVRWASALPVRQAVALYKQRDEGLSSISVNQLVAPGSPSYVVEIFGMPTELAHQGPGMVETLAKDSAYLRMKSGRTIKARRAEAQVGADNMTIRIYFPNTEPITVQDGEVEFFADVQIFSVRERFRLGNMVYRGQLEL